MVNSKLTIQTTNSETIARLFNYGAIDKPLKVGETFTAKTTKKKLVRALLTIEENKILLDKKAQKEFQAMRALYGKKTIRKGNETKEQYKARKAVNVFPSFSIVLNASRALRELI